MLSLPSPKKKGKKGLPKCSHHQKNAECNNHKKGGKVEECFFGLAIHAVQEDRTLAICKQIIEKIENVSPSELNNELKSMWNVKALANGQNE
jgi:hypothetical protein